jgi:hypothetical protein
LGVGGRGWEFCGLGLGFGLGFGEVGWGGVGVGWGIHFGTAVGAVAGADEPLDGLVVEQGALVHGEDSGGFGVGGMRAGGIGRGGIQRLRGEIRGTRAVRCPPARGGGGEVRGGDLDGVEDGAGALAVEGAAGEAGEDVVDGELDGGAVAERGQGEGGGFGGAGVGGLAAGAVVEAEVLTGLGGRGAALAGGPVLVAAELCVFHGGTPPGCIFVSMDSKRVISGWRVSILS